MNKTKTTARRRHIMYPVKRYTMTPEESKQWDQGNETDRRNILASLGDRVSDDSVEHDGCLIAFYHNDGQLVGKCTHHEPLFVEQRP
ncbi:MAG: hypothetical protein AMXMBFR84_04490 [Candidatus Hydrogenedentota bacterium]